MEFNKGDIVWVESKNRHPEKLKHPAVVWEYNDEAEDFYGVMLTHSQPNKRFDNILMSKTHFMEGQEVTFSNTHFVNQLFIKFHEWGPFHRAGALTAKGINFIEVNLTQTAPIHFDNYI